MGAFTYIETDTGTNVDISAATAVGAYTSTGDKLIMVDVSIDAVAGNGNYVMYVTRQIGGSGSAYRILPKTTMAAASGETAISAQSGWITVRNGDVLTCYVDGLAGDTSTPDWTTRWYELAGVTAAAVADAVLDEATSGHTSAGSFSKAVTDILADTGTDGVKIADTQGAITWGQQKIIADAAGEGALYIKNTNDNGVGKFTFGGMAGEANYGVVAAGVYNISEEGVGLQNEGYVYGVRNVGIDGGMYNKATGVGSIAMFNDAQGTDGIGLKNVGGAQNVEGFDPLQATEATLIDIKAKTDNLPATPAAVGSAMTLTSAGVDAILDEVVVGTYTMRKLLKLAGTVLAGKLTGGGTNTISFEGLDGTAGVVVATVDGNGNRSSVTITV